MSELEEKSEEKLIKELETLQTQMSKKLICSDDKQLANNIDIIELIGGIDISYDKNDCSKACVTCVVLNVKNNFEIIYKNNSIIQITNRYIPGFLAFREIEFLLQQYNTLKRNEPKLMPQVWLIDGNGLLHPRKFGLASHFGLLIDSPVIGVAKNPYYLTFCDQTIKDEHKKKICQLSEVGQYFDITNSCNEVIGAALKTTNQSKNPVYVSIGHKISLNTAVKVVLKCSKFRVPEPTRLADIISRQELHK